MKAPRTAAALALATALAACAPEVIRQPVDLAAGPSIPRHYEATRTTSVSLASGYSRSIAAGTRLVEAGSVRQGRVLKPVNTVFSVEGAHVHEAYLVLDGTRLVGFYLPVERAFTPLAPPIDFPLKETMP